MTPKKPKHIADIVSKKLDLPKDLVEDLYGYYWETIRKDITNINHAYIQIENLGTFELKPVSLDKTILKYENHIKKFDRTSFKKFQLYDKMYSRLQVLLNAKKMIEQEKETRKIFKNEKKSNRNLEGKG